MVQQLMEALNHKEISQAIGTSPSDRLDQEVANLKAFDLELLKLYSQLSFPLTRKVSKRRSYSLKDVNTQCRLNISNRL